MMVEDGIYVSEASVIESLDGTLMEGKVSMSELSLCPCLVINFYSDYQFRVRSATLIFLKDA